MRAIALSVLVLIACPPLVSAQLRTIPEDAIKATMQPPRNGVAKVGKYEFRLAPGAQIRSVDNRIVLPVMVNAEQQVRYQLDANGDLFRVWMLSPDEEDLPAPKQ
ncbi:MAG TPA: hypothetical protein VIO81_01950 [Methyloversatilis sp.]